MRPIWLTFVLLNIGVWLVGIGGSLAAPDWLLLIGRSCEAGAATVFAYHAWPRIRPALQKLG